MFAQACSELRLAVVNLRRTPKYTVCENADEASWWCWSIRKEDLHNLLLPKTVLLKIVSLIGIISNCVFPQIVFPFVVCWYHDRHIYPCIALVIIQQSVLHNNTRAYICVCTTMSAARCSHSIGCEQGIDVKDYLKDDGQKLFLQENKVKNKIWNLVLISTDKGSIVCLRWDNDLTQSLASS